MKDVIILANLGNRNIAVKGDDRELKEIARADGKSFRAYTQELVETQTPEQWAESLELRILPPLLEKYQAEAKAVYLFYTKQDDLPDGKPESDTEFSAQLAAELISKGWGLEVRLIRVDCVPVDTEQLMRFYRQQLLLLEEDHKDARWVIADAGGTSQQKSALKLVGEFLVHDPEKDAQEKIAFYNIVEERNGGSKLDPLPHNQFRKSLDILQATALIDKGLYKAADKILGDEYLSPILGYLDKRLSGFESDEVRKKIEYPLNQNKYNQWKTEAFNLMEQINVSDELAKAVAEKKRKPALERLQAAQFYMDRKLPGELLMTLMHFAEHLSFGAFKVLIGLSGDELKKKHDKLINSSKFEEWRNKALGMSELARNIDANLTKKNKKFTFGFAFDLAVAQKSPCEAVSHICSTFFKWTYEDEFLHNIINTTNLRMLRNKFAHEGIRFDFDEIEANIPGLRAEVETWPKLLGLPEENYYLRANRRLKKYLRELRS